MKKFTAYSEMGRLEGCELEAYMDDAGVWTIGYGHTKTARAGMSIPLDEAKRLLEVDLQWATAAINRMVRVELNQNQFDALTLFVYNIGEDGFARSTVLKRLNAGNFAGVVSAMKMWNKITVNGKKVVSNGLINRRNAEAALFMTPVNGRAVRPAQDQDSSATIIEVLPRPKVAAGIKAGGVVVALGVVLDSVAGSYGLGGVLGQLGGGEAVVGAALAWIATAGATYLKQERR